ncbi:hypothetical protein VSR69_35735 [Paraburkholderia phytofirmans]|uniref:hypothetical protein n=1 Tax=Paraburkholderia sp. BL9I2N2 TaxID=1938809 RepID=UPI0014053EB4|nr:hypothetical protein [Paraburkholderia sp. BL9I2N2]
MVSLNWLTRAQAEFSSGDRNDAAASVRKCLGQADLVSVWRQPEWHLGRVPRNRTGDLAAMPGQAK